MRKHALAAIALAAVVSVLAPGPVRAQDPLTVAPENYKLLYENVRVRVLEVTIPAGAKVELHAHPDHVAYVLGPGQLRVAKAGEEPNDMDLSAGNVLWIPAEAHWAQNFGKTEVRVLVTELKEPPASVTKTDGKP